MKTRTLFDYAAAQKSQALGVKSTQSWKCNAKREQDGLSEYLWREQQAAC